MKKRVILIMALCLAVLMAGCSSFSEGMEAGMKDAMSEETAQETEQTEETTEEKEEVVPEQNEVEEPEEVQEEIQEPVDTVEVEDTVVESDETQEEAVEEVQTEKQEVTSINVLLTAPITVGEVKNGLKTEVIGSWAQIVVDKSLLKETTMDEFVEFCNTVVSDSGHNWFTISCGDGTGIQFPGSMPYVATYGTLDEEGCIINSYGTIMIQEDGTYSYTETQ